MSIEKFGSTFQR